LFSISCRTQLDVESPPPTPRISMSTHPHPEGTSCGLVRSRFECLFPRTLRRGHDSQVQHPEDRGVPASNASRPRRGARPHPDRGGVVQVELDFIIESTYWVSVKPCCLLIHAKASLSLSPSLSLSRGGQGESLEPPCLVHAEASLSVFVIASTQRILQKVLTSRRNVDECTPMVVDSAWFPCLKRKHDKLLLVVCFQFQLAPLLFGADQA